MFNLYYQSPIIIQHIRETNTGDSEKEVDEIKRKSSIYAYRVTLRAR
jgi:hypothetical protein